MRAEVRGNGVMLPDGWCPPTPSTGVGTPGISGDAEPLGPLRRGPGRFWRSTSAPVAATHAGRFESGVPGSARLVPTGRVCSTTVPPSSLVQCCGAVTSVSEGRAPSLKKPWSWLTPWTHTGASSCY